eukprot:TRINITY_DN1366_c0_g1_i1.p1 TRINITY_DN1366_c0_g1~~TRINITY_DN1366_c0_g1_i1.p1  ORF type:complete len:452 (-),score=79.74 TRINITY_DN1366_c0_g1_i1:1411-2766(-)
MEAEETGEEDIPISSHVPKYRPVIVSELPISYKKVASLIYHRTKADSIHIVSGILFSILQAFTEIIENTIAGDIIDCVTGKQVGEGHVSLHILVSYLIVAYVLQCFAEGCRIYLFAEAGARLQHTIKSDLFWAIIGQDMRFFDDHKTGELVSRLGTDVDVLQQSISELLPSTFLSFIKLFGSILYLCYISWKLTFAMLCSFPLLGIAMYLQSDVGVSLWKKLLDIESRSTQRANESFGAIRTVKSFVQEGKEMKKYNLLLKQARKIKRKLAVWNAIISSGVTFSYNACIVLGMWYGGYLVQQEEISGGELIAYVLFALIATEEVQGFPHLFTLVGKISASSYKINEILDSYQEYEIKESKCQKNIDFVGEVEFRNVCFSYPSRKDIPILDNLSFHVKPGQTAALVGKSGQGKSTVMQLLQSIYYILFYLINQKCMNLIPGIYISEELMSEI